MTELKYRLLKAAEFDENEVYLEMDRHFPSVIVPFAAEGAAIRDKQLRPLIIAMADVVEAAELLTAGVSLYAVSGLIENYLSDKAKSLSDCVDDVEAALTKLDKFLKAKEAKE